MTAPATHQKTRLDLAVVERGLAETRSRARALILAGDVLLNGAPNLHAGTLVREIDELQLKAKPRFVSRGGEKLDHALDAFGIDVTGCICADLGASTGGFTDVLLQRGASRVYAVDVGYGQLDERVRTDTRVVAMERTNARYLDSLPEPVDLVVIDVSFISLSLILPVAARLLRPGGRCVPLIKPQFEAGRADVGKGGVVKDSAVHRRVLNAVLGFAIRDGFAVHGLVRSPLLGPSGNVEFLADLALDGVSSDASIDVLVDEVMVA
ncbi:MAG: TlyA family RNA methyltransferase [Thermomicrobiales bacterium]|nr:TlyA family RNA methyltransferase [Thermomicrobiales bacterium]